MSISILEQSKIQAQVLVLLLKAFQAEFGTGERHCSESVGELGVQDGTTD